MNPLTYVLEKGKNSNSSLKEFYAYLKDDKVKMIFTAICIFLNSSVNMVAPFLIARAVDTHIAVGETVGLLNIVYILIGAFIFTLITGYAQGILIGQISQGALYKLRDALFKKLQTLPVAFFNQNKAGDLMSRINNDTDKIDQFLSQSVSQFIGIIFTLVGILCFTLSMSVPMTLVMIVAIIVLTIITQILTPWVRKENKKSLQAVGNFSSALQENLTNFRVVAAYGKRDYLQKSLSEANEKTFKSALTSGVGNRIFEPIYDFGGAVALIAVLAYGFYAISTGDITIGILVAFVAYTQKFYDPMRYLAAIFGTVQLALAAWGRVQDVLHLENNLKFPLRLPENQGVDSPNKDLRLELTDVIFAYEGGEPVIENANLQFEKGKTYALIGPTGGGKSTLASLMAHLYDPTSGNVYLNGKNIYTYSDDDRAQIVSVILQDPILFNGTVAENIIYGNDLLENTGADELQKLLEEKGFKDVIARFESGLTTTVSQNGTGLSIGQKQLISFMRAILRSPKLLILDEATANIDTVTEAMLTKALAALPKDTTKVIIAHRLNTIKEADEIMFVNGRHVTPAGSYEEAISLISAAKRNS